MTRFLASNQFGRFLFAFTLLLTPAITYAQVLESAADLRIACEQAAENTITLQANTKIRGAWPYPNEQVNGGCTIIIPPDFKLEFEDVKMTFAGELNFASVNSGELKLKNASLHAQAVDIFLPGPGSLFSIDYANIGATAGDMTITFGDEGMLQTKNRLIPGDFYSLLASGTVRISGGARLSVNMEQNHVNAAGGFELSMSGSDSLLKCKTVRILAPAGAISIAAPSDKATVEFSDGCWLVARDQIDIGLSGAQSKISMKGTNLVRDVAEAPSLSILVEASGAEGSIDVTQVGLHNINSTVTLSAGYRGSLKVENAAAIAPGAVQFLSGFQGTTEVKLCNLISDVLVRIATGIDGNCNALGNYGTAPIVEACP